MPGQVTSILHSPLKLVLVATALGLLAAALHLAIIHRDQPPPPPADAESALVLSMIG